MFLFVFLDYLKWRCMQVSYFWGLKHWWEGDQEITAENIPKTYPQKPFNLVTSFLCWGENANTFFFFLNDLWVGVQSLTRFSSFQSNKFCYSNLCVRKLMLSNLWLLEFVFLAQAEHPHYLDHYWKLLQNAFSMKGAIIVSNSPLVCISNSWLKQYFGVTASPLTTHLCFTLNNSK